MDLLSSCILQLQEYQQKRQQKESPNNSAKASAEDEQSIDHQTSDSISDPDGDEAASAGVVSTEEDNSTLTTDFALEVGNLQLSSLQLTRESIGSNGDFHRSFSFSEDEQERSRNDITSDAAGSHEEPQTLVLYESEHERHGWNLGWVVIDMHSFTVMFNCFLLGCPNFVEGELILHPNGYNVFPFCCAVKRPD